MAKVLRIIALRSVTKEYLKWIDGNIDYVSPNDETFEGIIPTLSKFLEKQNRARKIESCFAF